MNNWQRRLVLEHKGINVLSVAEVVIDGLITSYTLLPVESLYVKIVALIYLYEQVCEKHGGVGKSYVIERIER